MHALYDKTPGYQTTLTLTAKKHCQGTFQRYLEKHPGLFCRNVCKPWAGQRQTRCAGEYLCRFHPYVCKKDQGLFCFRAGIRLYVCCTKLAPQRIHDRFISEEQNLPAFRADAFYHANNLSRLEIVLHQ